MSKGRSSLPAIPGTEEVDVSASGYMAMLERWEAVNRAIQRFLDDAQRTWRDQHAHTESTMRAEPEVFACLLSDFLISPHQD